MVTLIAKIALVYAGRSLAVGDRFDASESDARTLVYIGRAAEAPRKPVRKDLEADGELTAPGRRTYRRRDLTAEDSEG